MNEQCPKCEGTLELFDFGTARIYNRWVEWEHWKCRDCDYEWSNEPSYE